MNLAAKQLSAVEVSADASNQHEFHANVLRKLLDFPETPVSGTLEITYVREGSDEPAGEVCAFKLYDSREKKRATRSAEYRLYYASKLLQKNAAPGDVLILIRPDASTSLRGLILAQGSRAGRQVAEILAEQDVELKARFRSISTALAAGDLARILSSTSEPAPAPDAERFLSYVDPGFMEKVLGAGRLPSGRVMAEQATMMVEHARILADDPDYYLHSCLEAETALFKYFEDRIGQKALDELGADGRIQFADAMQLALSMLQSRKSRRGQSLQHHFAALLTSLKIPFDEQCPTEHGETPDFIVPGCDQYADPGYPAERLRMVACKTTLKERWGQILKEADRIPEKFLLTVDTEVTDETFRKMADKNLVAHLPAPVIDRHFADRPIRSLLFTVRELITKLREAQT